MYKSVIRPLLFTLNAEQAHHFTFKSLKLAFRVPGISSIVTTFFGSLKGHEKVVMGLRFKNPIGLAAGFDKDAKLYNELSAFGFGFSFGFSIGFCSSFDIGFGFNIHF